MRVALDTNIVVYAEQLVDESDRWKAKSSRVLIRNLLVQPIRPVLPAQVLFEVVEVCRRKFGLDLGEATAWARTLALTLELWPSGAEVAGDALAIVERHGPRIFDAVVVATAADARSDILLSEDMHDGFTWRALVVSNPFGARPDLRIAPLVGARAP